MNSRVFLGIGLVALAMGLGACSKSNGHVHILNGFDFPVTATITSEGGATETHEVPARGKVTSDVFGKGSVKVVTASGALVSENEAVFGTPKPDQEPCQRAFNILGAAAIAQEDVIFGDGFGDPHYSLKAGSISEDFCTARWVFEDPPESISVDAMGPGGRTIGWVHYIGDGSWATSVDALLGDTGEFKGQSRGGAQRIVQAVVTHDPSNPALAAIEARFKTEGLAFPKPK
jgi:hypothetical protein